MYTGNNAMYKVPMAYSQMEMIMNIIGKGKACCPVPISKPSFSENARESSEYKLQVDKKLPITVVAITF